MSTSLKELIVTFEANAGPVLQSLRTIDDKLKHTANQLKATSESFYRFGRELGLLVSLPIAALGGASIKAAANMQSLKASFTSVLERYNTGLPIQQAVTNEVDYLRSITDELGVSFEAATKPYLSYLAASRDNLETNRHVMKSFLGMSTALGLTSADLDRVIRALEQMQSKGTVMAEELKLQLGDTMPGALNLFAEAMGVTTQQFMQLMQNGQVSSQILSKVADVIDKKYGAAVDKGAKGMRANLERVSNAFYLFRANIGEGADQIYGITDKLGKFADWLKKLAINFSNLDDSGKKVILTIGGILAIVGPLLLGLGAITGIISIMITGFRTLLAPLMLVVEGFKLFRLMIATNPLFLFLTVTTLILLNWEKIVGWFQHGFEWIDKMFSKAWNWIKKIFGGGDSKEFNVKAQKTLDVNSISNFNNDAVKNSINGMMQPIDTSAKSAIAGATNSVKNTNNKTINNNLTVNIPPGTTAKDSESIKKAIQDALTAQTRQNYMELATQ